MSKYPIYFNSLEKQLEILGAQNIVLGKGSTIEELIKDYTQKEKTLAMMPPIQQNLKPQPQTSMFTRMKSQLNTNLQKKSGNFTSWIRRGRKRSTRKMRYPVS